MTKRRRIAQLERTVAAKDESIRRMAEVIVRQELRIQALKAERDDLAAQLAKDNP